MERIGTCIICIVLLFSVACPQGITPEPMPTITVHNDRAHTLYLDSGAWTMDVPALGSSTIDVEAGMWAVMAVWDDGSTHDPLVWAVSDSLEFTVSDHPITWTLIP